MCVITSQRVFSGTCIWEERAVVYASHVSRNMADFSVCFPLPDMQCPLCTAGYHILSLPTESTTEQVNKENNLSNQRKRQFHAIVKQFFTLYTI